MTEQEIEIRTICAIITGRCSSPDYAETSISTIIDEALRGSTLLLNELKEREQLSQPTLSNQ